MNSAGLLIPAPAERAMSSARIRYYRKRPLTVEAVRISTWNVVDVAAWCEGEVVSTVRGCAIRYANVNGVQNAHLGDWMVRGVGGEFYRVKHPNFTALYVESSPDPVLLGPYERAVLPRHP